MSKGQWLQWLAATGTAAITGAFVLLTYIHAAFLPNERFTDHQKTIHPGAVKTTTYLEDLRDLRQRLEDQSKKLDRIIEMMVKTN